MGRYRDIVIFNDRKKRFFVTPPPPLKDIVYYIFFDNNGNILTILSDLARGTLNLTYPILTWNKRKIVLEIND